MGKVTVSKHTSRRRARAKGRGWSKAASKVAEVDGNEGSDFGSDNSSSCSLLTQETQESSPRDKTGVEEQVERERLPVETNVAVALQKGLDYLQIFKGSKVMYVGGSAVGAVSHLADIVGPVGIVYAINTSPWASVELLELAKQRQNVVAIDEDPMMPYKYHRDVPDSVDFLFCGTQHQEQLRILILHARHFLRPGGYFAITLSGTPEDCGLAVSQLHAEQLETLEKIPLQPLVDGQVMAVGVYNLTIPEYLHDD